MIGGDVQSDICGLLEYILKNVTTVKLPEGMLIKDILLMADKINIPLLVKQAKEDFVDLEYLKLRSSLPPVPVKKGVQVPTGTSSPTLQLDKKGSLPTLPKLPSTPTTPTLPKTPVLDPSTVNLDPIIPKELYTNVIMF
jgi:hypothetical protein